MITRDKQENQDLIPKESNKESTIGVPKDFLQTIFPMLSGLLLGSFTLTIFGSAIFFYIFNQRIFPGVTINTLEVSGLTPSEAKLLLTKKVKTPQEYQITLRIDDIYLASSSAELGLKPDLQTAIDQAYNTGRSPSLFKSFWELTKLSFHHQDFSINWQYDESRLNNFIDQFKKKVNLDGENPSAELLYSHSPGSLQIHPGIPGREVLESETQKILKKQLSDSFESATLSARVASTSSVLNQDQIAAAKEKSLSIVGKRILFTADNKRLEITDQELIELLAFPSGYREKPLSLLLENIEKEVNRSPINAEFSHNPQTLKVETFVPDRPGLELSTNATKELLLSTLDEITGENKMNDEIGEEEKNTKEEKENFTLSLPVETLAPKTTLADTNNIGITERIGFGDSEYDHSIPNRIHNVAITSERINNTLVPPGEEFSFNKTLGEVSSKTGYRSAYVIKNGRTELGDGGGVCQVSTTVFRAVLDAGLDVTLRLPHSYRVSYYELNSKPGIDATVYAGNVDLRFINDTDDFILIHTQADSENLYMKVEIYGTSDGRTTEIKNHEVWGYIAPPPSEYYPDPSLPAGVVKQIDWSVAGMKAKFTHVIRDKEGNITHEQTYYSNYRPWAAKFLVGG